MGNRANYIVKQNSEFNLYYTHWRSVIICADLLLGARAFFKYISTCKEVEELLSWTYLEGCVFVDLDTKQLLFWEAEHLQCTTVRRKFLQKLQGKWRGWGIQYCDREMEMLGALTGLTYGFEQSMAYESADEVSMIDVTGENSYFDTLVILKSKGEVFVKYVDGVSDVGILLQGPSVVPQLNVFLERTLPVEGAAEFVNLLVIDCDRKKIWINQYLPGIEQVAQMQWSGWGIESGNFGYLRLLEELGISVATLQMTEKEVQEALNSSGTS